jgi:hypothetical protein
LSLLYKLKEVIQDFPLSQSLSGGFNPGRILKVATHHRNDHGMSLFVDHCSSPPLVVSPGRISASCRPPQEWPGDVLVVDRRSGPVVQAGGSRQ